MISTEHVLEELVQQEWQEKQEVLTNFLANREKIQNSPEFKMAFNLTDRTIRCVDEGTPGGLHCAGSCILLGLENALARLKTANADGITSHEGCGAAVAYCKTAGIDPSLADTVAREWAQKLAQASGLPYKGHITAEQMARPVEMHNAVCAYYDDTGQMNPALLKILPPGFVVSRKYFGGDDLDLCIQIALGDHGFGKRFSKENPFYVFAVSGNNNSEFSAEELAAEARATVEKYNGRVALESIILPV